MDLKGQQGGRGIQLNGGPWFTPRLWQLVPQKDPLILLLLKERQHSPERCLAQLHFTVRIIPSVAIACGDEK